jgi:myo-inositol 2-dehydrogenase / D-chiro-inositol 1-dehydrogenase
MASALIDQTVKDLNDHDTAVIIMRTASGRQAVITNYRKATYGYDQRIEVVGELGMLQAHNRRASTVQRWTATTTEAKDPLLYFFIERYKEAYIRELDSFIDSVEQGVPCSPGFEDGRRALLLANAAYESIKTGTTTKLAG